jgi:hypothetical protein
MGTAERVPYPIRTIAIFRACSPAACPLSPSSRLFACFVVTGFRSCSPGYNSLRTANIWKAVPVFFKWIASSSPLPGSHGVIRDGIAMPVRSLPWRKGPTKALLL